jgi:hypothetical protein
MSYNYVNGNPVMYGDPLGTNYGDLALVGGATIGTGVTLAGIYAAMVAEAAAASAAITVAAPWILGAAVVGAIGYTLYEVTPKALEAAQAAFEEVLTLAGQCGPCLVELMKLKTPITTLGSRTTQGLSLAAYSDWNDIKERYPQVSQLGSFLAFKEKEGIDNINVSGNQKTPDGWHDAWINDWNESKSKLGWARIACMGVPKVTAALENLDKFLNTIHELDRYVYKPKKGRWSIVPDFDLINKKNKRR